ncbi:hypothetical protein JCM4914_07200 [Streptomyces platensis subsp. malvinus]
MMSVGDGLVAVYVGVRGRGAFGPLQDPGIGLLHHAFAEIDEHHVVLENRVVEHELGGFAQVDDPVRERRRLDAVGHLLGVERAGGVVVAADAADPAGDEMRVARVLALHEHAVAAEERGRAPAFHDFPCGEVDFGVDAEVSDDAGDRVEGDFGEFASSLRIGLLGARHGEFLSRMACWALGAGRWAYWAYRAFCWS